MENLIVICGPTASGKTRLAVEIARRRNGEIISCDSRQVYRGMDIGTGKDLHEYGGIPRHLIDIAEPSETYTVFHYQRDFFRVFEEVAGRGRLPILAGGSGLYLEAVLKGYAIPEVPEHQAFRAGLMTRDRDSLDRELAECAPELYEKTDRSSRKRIVRSLEIARFGEATAPAAVAGSFPELRPLVIGVRWERQLLRKRIEARLRLRLQEGMVDEVKRLAEAGITRERLAMFGMEYKHIARYLAGEVGYSVMVAELLRDICRLAKRQETWFRGMERRGTPVHWVGGGSVDAAVAVVEGGLDRSPDRSDESHEPHGSDASDTTPASFS